MPRVQPLYSEFFYHPLTEDVEELLARFQHTDSIRYEEFSAIWREMSFSDVFIGIISEGEMKRFCRVALATAVKFFLPPYSYQIRVGALYLMYGLYYTQLATPPVQIRFAMRDWAIVQKFIKDSVDSGHQDIAYIIKKLVAAKAIHYVAMPHFLSFQKQRKPKREPLCAEFVGRTTAVQELASAEILVELANIQSQYENLKEATVEVKGHATMTHQGFSAGLKDCMSEFTTWQQKTFSQDNKDKNSDEEEDEETPTESSSRRARLLSSIKQKSYGIFPDASKSRRHRQGETVDSSGSGAEQLQDTALQRKRPPSLRARTWQSLGLTKENCKLQMWLLSAPEQERVPVKRTSHTAPFKA
ncbi:snRNA-activating protein complex subunit 1-like [Sebastes fasciatus]|uniref:snRNA-activating protein complex subunit 1-like n=1 Tax=Sebastes fasciatus TaxID=394691 RepID=UPI003D9F75C0